MDAEPYDDNYAFGIILIVFALVLYYGHMRLEAAIEEDCGEGKYYNATTQEEVDEYCESQDAWSDRTFVAALGLGFFGLVSIFRKS